MKAMLVFGLLLSGILTLGSVMATEQVIYQWRDSNNVLHVSQLPPANVEYQTIVIGAKTSGPAAIAKTGNAEKTSTDALQSCQKARDNLRILQQDLPVYLDLEDGSKQLLDDNKRAEQKQLAEKQIEFYCEKPATLRSKP